MKTKVFISWSGKNTASFRVAKKLAKWLPMVLQETEPFMSDNICSGTNPISQIIGSLADSKVGIICVTKDNIMSPWLNFEAGALNNVVTNKSGIVIPLLINMTTDEFAKSNSPIRNLQGKEFNDNDFKIVLEDINSYLESPILEKTLDDLYINLKQVLFDVDLSDLSNGITSQNSTTADSKKDEKPKTLEIQETISESKMTKKDVKSILGIGGAEISYKDSTTGGVDVEIYWRNNSDDVINHVTFYLLVLNIYNEPVTVFPCKITGPIVPVSKCIKNYAKYYRNNPLYYKTKDKKWKYLSLFTNDGDKKLTYTSFNFESGQNIKNYILEENYDKIAYQAKFDKILYNSTAYKVNIISAKIEYEDETIVNIDNDVIKYAYF